LIGFRECLRTDKVNGRKWHIAVAVIEHAVQRVDQLDGRIGRDVEAVAWPVGHADLLHWGAAVDHGELVGCGGGYA